MPVKENKNKNQKYTFQNKLSFLNKSKEKFQNKSELINKLIDK